MLQLYSTTVSAARMRNKFQYTSGLYVYGNKVIISYLILCYMLPIVQKIESVRTYFDGLAMSRGESAAMKLKMKGKIPRGRPRLRRLDTIDSHLKGKKTSLKEVLETKCFENRKYWRTLISY